jgi:hypothetical protein
MVEAERFNKQTPACLTKEQFFCLKDSFILTIFQNEILNGKGDHSHEGRS